jgi:hypothetical protein
MIYLLEDHRHYYIVIDTVNHIASGYWCKSVEKALKSFINGHGTTESWPNLSHDYLANKYTICTSYESEHGLRDKFPEYFI